LIAPIADGSFGMLSEDQMDYSILAKIGNAICWIFKPQGWGNWQATVASVTGTGLLDEGPATLPHAAENSANLWPVVSRKLHNEWRCISQ